MEANKKDYFDFECINCQHEFDASEAEVINDEVCCPKCKSKDILDLTDEY